MELKIKETGSQTQQTVPETKERLSLRVLLADDEEMMRDILKATLQSMGHKVKAVTSGQFLIDELRGSESYDLIISDNSMPPGKKGVDVLEEIRSNEEFKKIPFILATTDSSLDGSLPKKIAHFGGFFLAKPFKREELSNAIDQVTKR